MKFPTLPAYLQIRFLWVLAIFFGCAWWSVALAAGHGKKHKLHQVRTMPFAPRAEMAQLAADISQEQQLPAPWVRHQLSMARRVQGLEKIVMPPPTSSPKNWAAYQARFVEPRRIMAGVKFWRTYQEALQRAQISTGYPPSWL